MFLRSFGCLAFRQAGEVVQRRLGGLLLCSLAVNGGCPVVRGVLWAFWGFVVEFIEGLFYVARHGDVDISFGIVPGKGEATVLCPFPID